MISLTELKKTADYIMGIEDGVSPYERASLLTKAQEAINNVHKDDVEKLSDNFHSFKELYEFRTVYNAALFNEWAKMYYYNLEMKEKQGFNIDIEEAKKSSYYVHKSWKHFDGELCFGGGWFIVSAMLPSGLISNHYKAKDWDLFKIPEVEKALFEFDGHDSKDVLKRLKEL
jgi:hypothetical protein